MLSQKSIFPLLTSLTYIIIIGVFLALPEARIFAPAIIFFGAMMVIISILMERLRRL